jgi:PncC family amidohydrolase
MAKIEQEIAHLIRQYQSKTGTLVTIGSIESATGGRIGDKITNVSGSSDYFKGSIVSYNNEIKTGIVGVKEETIKIQGAVSAETVAEMAEGGKKLLKVDICISDTGIAGPTGATAEKPVGLFYLGLAAEGTTLTRKHIFTGNRDENKQSAAEASMEFLKEYIEALLDKTGERLLEEKHVVTCFLKHKGNILILKRSQKVGSYPGKWAGVSGYIEKSDIEQAYTEIKEETGLDKNDVELSVKGEELHVLDANLRRQWVIHPFLFLVRNPDKIKFDWEHTEIKWISPANLINYETVPGLKDVLDRVNRQDKSLF